MDSDLHEMPGVFGNGKSTRRHRGDDNLPNMQSTWTSSGPYTGRRWMEKAKGFHAQGMIGGTLPVPGSRWKISPTEYTGGVMRKIAVAIRKGGLDKTTSLFDLEDDV